MVVQDFPAAKLFILLLRQISKPISNFIKRQANEHMYFRSYVCMPPAYFYNWCEVKAKMWTMNLGKPTSMPQLNESMAIDLGSQILGEATIFFVAAFLVCVEYSRQAHNEEKKEELAKEELYRLDNKIQELDRQVVRQTTWIHRLHHTVNDLHGSALTLSDAALFGKPESNIKKLNTNENFTQTESNEGTLTPRTSQFITPCTEHDDYYRILFTMP